MEQSVIDVLNLIPFGALATTNEDGSPHVVPMHFCADDRNMYWFSMEDAQHSQNIARNPMMSFAVWTPDRIPNLRGVSISSMARRVDNEYDLGRGKVAFTTKFPEIPDAFADYEMYMAPLGQTDRTKVAGNTQYLDGRTNNF